MDIQRCNLNVKASLSSVKETSRCPRTAAYLCAPMFNQDAWAGKSPSRPMGQGFYPRSFNTTSIREWGTKGIYIVNILLKLNYPGRNSLALNWYGANKDCGALGNRAWGQACVPWAKKVLICYLCGKWKQDWRVNTSFLWGHSPSSGAGVCSSQSFHERCTNKGLFSSRTEPKKSRRENKFRAIWNGTFWGCFWRQELGFVGFCHFYILVGFFFLIEINFWTKKGTL